MTISLIRSLAKLHIITPRGIIRLVRCFMSEGINLMALLRFSSLYYGNRTALVFEGERLTYNVMYQRAKQLSTTLYNDYGVRPKQTFTLHCRNDITTTLSLIALSYLGANIKLRAPLPISQDGEESSSDPIQMALSPSEGIGASGSISLLSGGSSGNYTEATRKNSITQFLPPLFALLNDIHIQDYDSVLITLPYHHGFGLATFIVSLLMGKKMCLMSHFDTRQALTLIEQESIEVLPLVPALITRLMLDEKANDSLRSVKCIISGGDKLERTHIAKTMQTIGRPVLFNLYGTSEAGFFMLANPSDLTRFDDVTIGKPIAFAKCQARNTDQEGHGELWVKTGWSMTTFANRWQNTGDIVFRNSEGYYFYKGRKDNMIVCAGENVYPENVERILNSHPLVLNSHVFPVSDPNFGTVLHAKVELMPSSSLSIEELRAYLRPKLSRAEMPHHIIFTNIELLSSGKKKKV